MSAQLAIVPKIEIPMPEKVRAVWEELGIKNVRMLGRKVMVMNYPFVPKTHGGIWLPPKLHTFYGGLPHMRVLRALVLSAGPKCQLVPGDEVCFQRLHFALWKDLDTERKVGWIDELQIIGHAED